MGEVRADADDTIEDTGTNIDPVVVLVGNNDPSPRLHRVIINPLNPRKFIESVRKKTFPGSDASMKLAWTYADGEEFNPIDPFDIETLLVFAQCEMLASRPLPLLRVRQFDEALVPLSAVDAIETMTFDEIKKLASEQAEVESHNPLAEEVLSPRDWPTSNNWFWRKHLEFIKPPESFPDDEVSDCMPWLRRSHFINKFIEIFSLIVILVSVVVFCIETIPTYRIKENGEERGTDEPVESLFVIEATCVAWFTVEYLWRLFYAPFKWKFIKHPLNVIDLIAIIPFYASFGISGGGGSQLTIVRILRLSRVSRLAKVSRHSTRLQDMVTCISATQSELVLFFLITSVATILFASAAFYAEKDEPDTDFISIPAGFWWALVTMTTVGYGDMSPTSVGGKIVGALCASLGVILLAIPAGIFISEFMKLHEERQRAKAIDSEATLTAKLEHHLQEALQVIEDLEKTSLETIKKAPSLASPPPSATKPTKSAAAQGGASSNQESTV